VAEGIEHTEQREQRLARGCAYGQGYLFAKPVGADVVSSLLQTGGRALAESLEEANQAAG
jgi:EAL domain-containing protein (putative c-di-GMP-specific phosphodiesterase class I)